MRNATCAVLSRDARKALSAVARTERGLVKTRAKMATIEAGPRWNGKLRWESVAMLDMNGKPIVQDGQPVTERIFFPVTMRQQFRKLAMRRRIQSERLLAQMAWLRTVTQ